MTFLFIWFINVNSSEKTEWYIEFYSDENTIHKIGRDLYLEAIELIEGAEDHKYRKQYHNLLYNESIYYTANYDYYELKTLPLYKINY